LDGVMSHGRFHEPRLEVVATGTVPLNYLAAVGHSGVPTLVFNGAPFFGQDSFDMLVWRLKQTGLQWKGEE
jgi:2-hydroxychromene-2-carboxylate isomerase